MKPTTVAVLMAGFLALSSCRSNINNGSGSNTNNSRAMPTENANSSPTPGGSPANSTVTNGGRPKEFNPYRGSIEDLLPMKVSNGRESWERIDNPVMEGTELQSLGAVVAKKARYGLSPKNGDEHKIGVLLDVGNFSSAADANAALQKEADERKVQLSPKRKDGKIVGNEMTDVGGIVRFWTNGTLFISLSKIREGTAEHVNRFQAMLPY